MVADLTYSTVEKILDSWETVRRIPYYEEVAGVMIFRRLFELAPSARNVFAFGKDELTGDLYKSPRLISHAKFFVKMIDRSLNLLGPDIELLTVILLDLGKQHVELGVKASYYPSMGLALLGTIKELIGAKFTPKVEEAWLEVYKAMSYDMIRAVRL